MRGFSFGSARRKNLKTRFYSHSPKEKEKDARCAVLKKMRDAQFFLWQRPPQKIENATLVARRRGYLRFF
jgi:hypothetical protein